MFFIARTKGHISIGVDRRPRKYCRTTTRFAVVAEGWDYFWLVVVIDMESEKVKMTDLKQLERDTQNINGLNEHGSYCECIWCLEGDTQPVETSDLAKREVEQEMTAMLKDLPLAIAITKQGDLHRDEYTWQCMGTSGKAYSFVDATRQALQSLVEVSTVARV